MDSRTFIEKYLPEEMSAELAGLRYAGDQRLGITRKRTKKTATYFDPQGKTIDSEKEIIYLNSLAIPPAWKGVWISPHKKDHLLATGFDAKKRKQYIYHPKWRQIRDLLNAYRMVFFGQSLSLIRKRVEKDFLEKSLTKDQVLATVVKVLDETYIRVGNELYADENDSYGLTTLRDKHVESDDDEVVIRFIGKSGKEHELVIDEDLATAIEKCKELKGRRLFQYIEGNERYPITAHDVNTYLRQVGDFDFTAKDFRTWGGTLKVYECMTQKLYDVKSRKKPLIQAFEMASSCLGNTPAIVRKSYVHPHLIQAIEDGTIDKLRAKMDVTRSTQHLSRAETELMVFLELLFQSRLKDIRV